MSNNYTRKNNQASSNKQQTESTQGPKIATVQSETETSQTKNKMGFAHTVKAKQPGPPPGFEKNNRRSSTGPSNPSGPPSGIWSGNSLANGWEHNNGDSGLLAGGRRSMGGNGFGKYSGFQNASSAIRPQQNNNIGPHATFKTSKKPIQIDTSGSLLQSSVSMFVPGMDSEWAKSHRNKFLQTQFSSVRTGMENAKIENGRLTGTFEYIEKEATSSKNLPYMLEFVPLDIEEHKVNLYLKKSDSKNSSIDSSRSNSRTESKTDHKNDQKSETKNGAAGMSGSTGSASAKIPTVTNGNTKNSNQTKGSKNSKSTTSNNSSRPRGRH